MARWSVVFVALLLVAAAALVVAELGPEEGDWELIKTVVEEQESESDDLTAATYLTITVSGNTIKGTTHGGKTFSGTGAKGFGTGAGISTRGRTSTMLLSATKCLRGLAYRISYSKMPKAKLWAHGRAQ
ncbi:hypothetical protein GOP47_0004188 [Adiantum capillus-veneris]|uniref:Dirigent protein n=1 Tax=Adiantum capillus-veneris TaxID=13818 RepID=A0A9D4V7S6_ADICA|nr:hypothetical protein GOP47_0004188 [Adiantum capillus-veneris]